MPVVQPPPDVLTPEQRDHVSELLGSPIKFPSEFKQWLSDFLAVNIPPIPVSQLLGYKGTLAHNEIVNAEILMNSANFPERTWGDASDGLGPEVTGLADGTYFAAFGCKTGRGNTGGMTSRYGPGVNGAAPTGQNFATFYATDPDAMVWKACVLTVKDGTDNNSVTMKYWFDGGGGFTAQFLHRWLTLIRVT